MKFATYNNMKLTFSIDNREVTIDVTDVNEIPLTRPMDECPWRDEVYDIVRVYYLQYNADGIFCYQDDDHTVYDSNGNAINNVSLKTITND